MTTEVEEQSVLDTLKSPRNRFSALRGAEPLSKREIAALRYPELNS